MKIDFTKNRTARENIGEIHLAPRGQHSLRDHAPCFPRHCPHCLRHGPVVGYPARLRHRDGRREGDGPRGRHALADQRRLLAVAPRRRGQGRPRATRTPRRILARARPLTTATRRHAPPASRASPPHPVFFRSASRSSRAPSTARAAAGSRRRPRPRRTR